MAPSPAVVERPGTVFFGRGGWRQRWDVAVRGDGGRGWPCLSRPRLARSPATSAGRPDGRFIL